MWWLANLVIKNIVIDSAIKKKNIVIGAVLLKQAQNKWTSHVTFDIDLLIQKVMFQVFFCFDLKKNDIIQMKTK